MDTKNAKITISLMKKPAFWAKEGYIQEVNASAEEMGIAAGQSVFSMLSTGQAEYASFSEGCLFLTLSLPQKSCGAVAFITEGKHLFILNSDQTEAELHAFSLVASQIRYPMLSMTIFADRLSQTSNDPAAAANIAGLRKSIFQLLRIVNNMTDVSQNQKAQADKREICDAAGFFGNILEKVSLHLPEANLSLSFDNLETTFYCLLDKDKLNRAVYNMLSNAAKYAPKETIIHAALKKEGEKLLFSVENETDSSAKRTLQRYFWQYARDMSLYDSETGIGLGMTLITLAAQAHKGTLHIAETENGVRMTLSLCIESRNRLQLRSPSASLEYSTGRDPALVELSDVLPINAFEK